MAGIIRDALPHAAQSVLETDESVEVSVVMPCLNESDTLDLCIVKTQAAFSKHNIIGEIIVADNGSTDNSREIATRLGARVVTVLEKGYGNALMGGIAAARGKYLLIGDADDSYDFGEIPKFIEKLREGFDLVQGCRLPSGGGTVKPGAMPFLHYWWGNPMFSFMARNMFRAPIHDICCGMRGFTKIHYERLDLRCTGMEFANEMIIKSSLFGGHIDEIPITLWPDGRKSHPPHLKTFRDGWRTLRFYMLYSPKWLFMGPGIGMIAFGLLGYALAMPGCRISGVTLDVHTVLCSSLALLMGFQSVLFAVFAKVFAISERLLPADPRLDWLFKVLPLERALILSVLMFLAGCMLLVVAVGEWHNVGFGALNYEHTMRMVIPGVTLAALGFQSFMSSWFVSILTMQKKRP